jgi:hypothetical protein
MRKYEPGDYVKVEFKDGSDPIGEWMWVRVDSSDERKRIVFGTLDNEPIGDYGRPLARGSQLAISFDKIREDRKPSEFKKQ